MTIQARRANQQDRKGLAHRIWEYRYVYLLVLPGMLFFWIFRYGPMYGIQLAFKNYMPNLGIIDSPWVGFDNFTYMFAEADFWNSFRNTLVIAAMQVAVVFPFPIILSLLLNEVYSIRYKKVVQTILTFPHFLSWVILSGIILNMMGESGAINNRLVTLNLEKFPFLTSKGFFRWLLIISLMWKESGWSCILYLATITSIDPALYEAATMDGANRWHRMRYVTWPGILPIVVTMFILRLGTIMDAGFQQVLNLYNPAVYSVGDINDTYVYRITFEKAPKFGVSTAVGMFKGVANCILMLSANFISQSVAGESVT
jgi:putative aldouronate transport system permease protein